MRALASLALLLAIATPACGPSIDPAFRRDLDRKLATLETSEQTYPPSESFLPMAFVVGQWTQHRILDEKGQPTLLTYKLVGQENGGYWIETVIEDYNGRRALKLHVALLSGRDPAGMEIRAVRIKQGSGAPVDVDPNVLAGTQSDYRHVLGLLTGTWEGLEKDDAKVPAGRFIGCYKSTSQKPWGPWTRPSMTCAHPSVPLSGVVRSQTADRSGVMELVNFGTSGAESEF
jgi:hypothetical protein